MNKVSFSWKPTISGREKWRWGLYMWVASRSGRSKRLRIMVRGLLLWLVGLAVAAYLVATTAWFVTLSQRNTNYVTWQDCVLAPFRWEEIKRKRGDAYIAEGLVALENRKWSEAILRIRAGLTRSPDNWKGRRNLGMFYLAAGQRQQGLDLLADGFTHRYQGRDAMAMFLSAALAGESYERALGALDDSLQQSGRAVARDRAWLVDQKCRVLMAAERYEDALAWIAEEEQMSEVRHESKVVALIELGRYAEAHEAMADWAQGSGSLGGVRRIAVRLAREENDLALMRATLTEIRERAPLEAPAWVYGIVQEHMFGEYAAAAEAMAVYLMRFDSKAQNYVLAARPLKEIEAWELFDDLVEHATLRGIKSMPLEMLRLDAAILRGHYDEARGLLDGIRQGSAELAPRVAKMLELMSPLIEHLAQGLDGSRERLIESLQLAPVSLAFLRSSADRLETQGREVAALSVWEIINRRFPDAQDADREITRLRLVLGEQAKPKIEIPLVQDGTSLDLDAVLAGAMEVESTYAATLQTARRFTRVAEEMIAGQRWAELDNLMRELRLTNPPWMSSQNDLITRTQIELDIAEQNWPTLISNVRFRLDGSVDRALEIMKLVRRLDDLGERRAAELVLAEVERRHPNFPPARRVREDWAPPPEETVVAEGADDIEPLPVR